MKSLTPRVVPMTVLMTIFAVGSFYAQQHGGACARQGHSDASRVSEIFCSHAGTGQLCPGNAEMFKLSGTEKERYLEAVSNYNKAIAAASKQFLADAKDKVGLSPAKLALAESWFATGLNPEINKILATKTKR